MIELQLKTIIVWLWTTTALWSMSAAASISHAHHHSYISTGYTSNEDSSLIVRTNKGLVRGQRVRSITKKWVDEYLGIPYAKPPIGELRFRHPRPIDPWQGIFNATKPPNSCYQTNDTTFGNDFPGTQMWNANTNLDEDCLTLSIWVPYPRLKNAAVLVWIYGGAFNTGTTTLDLYNGKLLASEENIILVNINYRVASLGFLYFEKARHEISGNAGMFDQVMALQWIHDNIAFFGGNPNNVTLFGESAGAVSVGFHLLSPLSQHLFSQAILQSGAPTAPWGLTDTKKLNENSLLLAENVGCGNDENDIASIIDCMRTVDPMRLVYNESLIGGDGVVDFSFTPIRDGVFLDREPQDLLDAKLFKHTRLLLGSNKEEGSYFIIYKLNIFKVTEDEIYINRYDFNKSLKELLPGFPPLANEAINLQYTNWLNPDDAIKNRDAIDKLVGDYFFTCHVNKLAERYAETGNEVFMYYFTHRSTTNPWPKWMGTMHGYEIPFIFGEPLDPKYGYTPDEVTLSKRMMKSWANFAKTGNPTVDENQNWSNLHWPIYTNHKKEYLEFNTNYSIGHGPRIKECFFWHKYFPDLMSTLNSIDKEMKQCHNSANSIASNHSQQNQWFLMIIAFAMITIINSSYYR